MLKSHSAACSFSRAAFTLIELLVVISIISLLIAILLPSLAAARKSAMRAKCLSQIRQVYIGATLYTLDFDNKYPVTPFLTKWGNSGSSDEMSSNNISSDGAIKPPNNVSGWYQFRSLGHVQDKALDCPSLKVGGGPPNSDLSVKTKLCYGYRYNTFGGCHELLGRGSVSGLPSTYPRQEMIKSTTGALFVESCTYRRPNNNTSDDIYLFHVNGGQQYQWAHEVGGNVALFDGSAHFLGNQMLRPLGAANRQFGAWPVAAQQAPYAFGLYGGLGQTHSIDAFIRTQLGG